MTTEWLPTSEQAESPESITHYRVLRNDGISSVSLASGDIDVSTEPASGIYYRDTRYLSLLRFSLGTVEPRLLDANLLPNALTAVFTNPPLITSGGAKLPGQQLVVQRRRVIDGSVMESLTFSNYARHAVTIEVRVRFDADFRDIFEVRGFERRLPPPTVTAEISSDSVSYRCMGADGVDRTVALGLSRPATRIDRDEAAFLLELEPRGSERIEIEVCIAGSPGGREGDEAAARVQEAQQDWLDSITAIETSDEVLNAAINRSLVDIYSLRSAGEGHAYIAAGVPWFDTLFGRDSLITGIELAGIAPDVLRQALSTLAYYQATAIDTEREAEVGKIPHELRWGELAGTGEVPFGAYYGSIDATPLFVLAAAEYLRWTDDRAFLGELRPALDCAIAWCELAEERGGGLLEYHRQSPQGLDHQGWKDSHDGVSWPDGSAVDPPIALVEVQGYLAAAYAAYAYMVEAAEPDTALRMHDRAQELVERLETVLGDASLGYALCRDGECQKVATPTSNSGHLLWTGAANAEGAARVAQTLLGDDLFTGWGVRTMGASVVGYNPLGYHTGSVWPHDNAIILAGLRRYGFDAEAGRLGSALVQLIVRFPDYQVPELFSGDPRDLRLVPTPYPVSSRPQAWSAAAVPYVLVSMLGVRPVGGNRVSITRPLLPSDVSWIRLRGLKRGSGTADLLFTRNGEHVAVEVERIDGEMEVVLSQSFPDPLLGRER